MTTISNQTSTVRVAGNRTQVKSDTPAFDSKKLVDKIVDSTYLGANYTASGLSGMAAGVGGFVRSAPGATLKTTASLYKNMWKAETIGPNLKILGSVVAAPIVLGAAAIGLPVSLAAGLYQGADEVDSSKPREFTISAATKEAYQVTTKGWNELSADACEGLEKFGNTKLEAGERPIDIPIIRTAKTLAVGAAAAAVGGVAGLVSAVVGGGREIVSGVVKAFGDENLNIAGKVIAAGGAVVGGAIHGTVYGAATAVSILGTGIGQTWKSDSVFEGSRKVLSHAASSIGAAASPKAVLLEEVPEQK